MDASSVALKLRSEQATCHFFCNFAGLLGTVAHACASPGVTPTSLSLFCFKCNFVTLSMLL